MWRCANRGQRLAGWTIQESQPKVCGSRAKPHYVLTATRPCEQFTLRVRFHPDRLPRWVRRVNGEPVRMIDIVASGPEPLAVDAAGEIYTEFDQPMMYLAHGAQWQPDDGPAG